MQEWFAARAFPALVLGTCHPSIRLPALDVDNRSVCRHASGLLLAKGHRSLALLLPTSVAAGTLASEQGFLESIRLRPSPEKIHTRVARHRSTTRSVERLLDGFFKGTEPPTALVVAPAEQVLPVFFYLLRRNLLEKVSLISRDQHHLWADLSPAISHYGFEEQMLSDRLARLMLQLVNQGYLSTKPNLIYRRFFPGGTVSRPA